VPFPGGDAPSVDELAALATALRRAVEGGLVAESESLKGVPRIASGQAVLFRSPARRFERSVVRAVHAARTMMRGEDAHARLSRKLHLADIIDRAHLTVAYQPIVDIKARAIAGYEALCRGPQGTPFEVADFLFNSSHELELAHELDETCRRLILSRRPAWPEGRLLFVNVLPDAIASGLTTPDKLLESLSGFLPPRQVVLEMLERGRVGDWKIFRKRLAAFREAGFQLACDDVGTGVSSLRLVPEVEPDFLKVDLSLVRGVHESRAQQGVLVTLVELAARVGAEVICEGIEEQEELDVVESLGVRYAQGFLLARPAPVPRPEL
jgi:EAL domain-containing protein (putative c-di-GMP-specific phosphodiesterase class I)